MFTHVADRERTGNRPGPSLLTAVSPGTRHPSPQLARVLPPALAVAFIASEYGPEDAAEEPAGWRAASSTRIVRDDRSRSILHSVAASSGGDDIEFVTLPPGIAAPLCQIVTPTAIPPARRARKSRNIFLLW